MLLRERVIMTSFNSFGMENPQGDFDVLFDTPHLLIDPCFFSSLYQSSQDNYSSDDFLGSRLVSSGEEALPSLIR